MLEILHNKDALVNEFYNLLDDAHFTAHFSFFCFNKHPMLLSSILEHHIEELNKIRLWSIFEWLKLGFSILASYSRLVIL